MPNNISVAVVVDNHIHFCNASNFIVDFKAVEIVLCKSMPKVFVTLSLVRVCLPVGVLAICFSADVVESVEQKATGTTCRVKNHLFAVRGKHLNAKGD